MIYFIGEKIVSEENSTIAQMVEYFSDKEFIAFDTETTGFDPYVDRILSYQLGDSNNQFVVDAKLYPVTLIKDLLLSRELIIHNAKFDFKFLYHRGIYPPKVWDTFLAESILYRGDKTVRKSLEECVRRYFSYDLVKSTRGKINYEGFSPRVIRYCAEDVKFLTYLREAQYRKLSSKNLLASISLENLFVKVLTYIEYSGIYIDANLWKEKVKQDEVEYRKAEKALNSWIIENNINKYIERQLDLFSTEKKPTIDWSSPKQTAELFSYLGINTKVVDEVSGELKDSVESKVLEKQESKFPIIPIYLSYKKKEKILSTYGNTVLDRIHPLTGRIHTTFTQIMDTGRISSGGKKDGEGMINLQNIPRLPDQKEKYKIYERDCFTHDKGNILINADYSGQEQVVFANLSADKDLLYFYEQGLGDMHAYIASKIFAYLKDVPLKDIKAKYKKERQIAKSAGFAINYGGSGDTIADNLNISKEEGDQIYKSYFEAFPGIGNYFKKVAKDALAKGYILFNTISNGKYYINNFDKYHQLATKVHNPGFWDAYKEEKNKDSELFRKELKPLVSKYFKIKGDITRKSYNYPVQGSSAEISKLACIYIFEELIKNNYINIVKFSNAIHDEILLECPYALKDVILKIVLDCMNRAGDVYCKLVPLRAEGKICEFWDH